MARETDSSWQYVRPKAELSRLPARIDLSPGRAQMLTMLIVGLAWMGFATYFALSIAPDSGSPGAGDLMRYVFLLFPAFGVFIVAPAVWRLLQHRHAVVDKYLVTVEGWSLLGREAWRVPLDTFLGVRHRTGIIRRKRSSTTYQIIELVHPDPKKTILLWVERGDAVPRERWETYARLLNLAALNADGVARDREDLDKSLRQMVQEGKVPVAFDPAGPVPQGLQVNRLQRDGQEMLEVMIQAPRLPGWLVVLFVLILLPVGIGVLLEGENPFGLVVVIAMLGLVFYMRRHDRQHPRLLQLTRQAISYDDKWGGVRGSGAGLSLPLDQVEQVHLADNGRELVIASDRGQIRTGAGLDRAALDWLKNYLTATILHA